MSSNERLYRHTLFFASEMEAETAEMIVPSHVDGFAGGGVNPYEAFNEDAYTFLTRGKLSDIACQDITKLARAQRGSMNTRH